MNYFTPNRIFALIIAFLLSSCAGESFDDGIHTINLDESIQLRFIVHEGLLLGLSDVVIDGTSTSGSQTVLRPVIAQEYHENRHIYPLMKLKSIKQGNGRVEVVAQLLSTTNEEAYRDHFVFALDSDKAATAPMEPELEKMREEVNQYQHQIREIAIKNERIQGIIGEMNSYQQMIDQETEAFEKKRLETLRDLLEVRKERTINQVISRQLRNVDEYQPWFTIIDAYDSILNTRIHDWGKIHRDQYFFAHLQQPETLSNIDHLKSLAGKYDDLRPGGTITWTFETEQRTIAGWPWKGWSHSAQVILTNGRKVNAIRFLETRELEGHANELTLIGLRYRGLGKIEQQIVYDDQGRVQDAWSTSDILPTLLGQTVAISPVIPPSVAINDRGYALLHRAGSWLIYPPRGAGSSFMDFQYRNNSAMVVFREKQGNYRGLTETYPGDQYISFTEEERFDYTDRFSTTPIVYLVARTAEAHENHFWRNRWKEADQYIRDVIAEELGFVQADVLPAIGMNWDFWRPDRTFSCALENLDSLVDILAGEGVKMVLNHNSGWINGNTVRLGMDGADPSLHVGGGSCNVVDWQPLPHIRDSWRRMNTRMGKHDMAYFIWSTGFSQYYGNFYREVGDAPQHWALNQPLNNWRKDQIDWSMPNHRIRDDNFRKIFNQRKMQTFDQQGFQGIWCDSFQLSWMSQLDYATGRGGSMQREWWEQIAQWTQNNIAFMSESVSIPGLSCSIEVADWEESYWAFQHVSKWLRNGEHRHYNTQQLDSLSFLLMANRGGLSFDILEWSYCDQYWTATDIVPNFTRYASEYMAALPSMSRPYILPQENGMLYLPFETDQEAVFFSFTTMPIPGDLLAGYILTDEPAEQFRKFYTYRLKGENILQAFGIETPVLDDERRDYRYNPFEYIWPND